MIYSGLFFLIFFTGFNLPGKGALRTLESLGLPGMKGQVGILERKCIDMRGVSG